MIVVYLWGRTDIHEQISDMPFVPSGLYQLPCSVAPLIFLRSPAMRPLPQFSCSIKLRPCARMKLRVIHPFQQEMLCYCHVLFACALV